MANQVRVLEIAIEKLVISPLNVRKDIGDISELADSIREEGVLQPLLVRPAGDKYEIIVGSRRFTAAKQVGIIAIPAVVRELTDAQAVAASLTENLQRGDLTLEERVEGYKKLRRLDSWEYGSSRGLAKVTGVHHSKIERDFDAYEALTRLREHFIKVSPGATLREEERKRGEALPERHAALLEQAFSSVHGLGRLDPTETDRKYVELAREIAPLDQDDARKVLDYFKMYPEKPVDEIKAMALAKVEREVSLDAVTARKLDELAQTTGKKWEEVITSLVETAGQTPVETPAQLVFEQEREPVAPRFETLELPEEPLSEQIIGKTLWNVEQAERAGLQWDFYTIGYSQKTIEQFIHVIKIRGIATIVDIRHDPVSIYKPEFSKENLRRALESENITYIHMPDLGVPREIRSQLAKTADWETFFQWYDDYVIPRLKNGLMSQLKGTVKEPITFMCVEQNPTKCHRHRVALALGQMGLKGADL